MNEEQGVEGYESAGRRRKRADRERDGPFVSGRHYTDREEGDREVSRKDKSYNEAEKRKKKKKKKKAVK